MYQSIDDNTDELTAQESSRGSLVGGLMIAGVAGAVILGLVYVMSPGPKADTDPIIAEPEARAAYLRAISEPRIAIRRARLTDFLNQHSQNNRAIAARAQLDVIDYEESVDWESVLSAFYDPSLPVEDKAAAITDFETRWAGYLGARDAEITELRRRLENGDDKDRPDRELEDRLSPIPPTVPGDVLAGGSGDSSRGPTIIAPPSFPGSRAYIEEVVQARAVRDVAPSYPRRALRRNVEAVVILALDIDARGRVGMTEVVSVNASRYERDFIRAAERAALRTRFYPKTVNGEPVPVRGVQKRYRFEMP